DRSRHRLEDVALDLYVDLGGLRQVPVPAGMLRRSALRGDDHVVVASLLVDQRRRRRLAGPPARRRQQERLRPALPDVTDGAVRLAVTPHVLLTEERLSFAHR